SNTGAVTLATVPVSKGGTGTATAFTQGSVVYAGVSGTYSQDNANFFWDGTNHRLGIGTTTPSTKLDVAGSIQVADGGEACSVAGDGGMIRYNGGSLQYCNGSSWQTLGISGAGLTSFNGQTGSSQSLAAPGTSGTA